MIVGSKNKGDWSEFYVLLYLVGTRQLDIADGNLNKIPGDYVNVHSVYRNDAPMKKVELSLKNTTDVEIYLNGALRRRMKSSDFLTEATLLYRDMKIGKGSFDIPHGEMFLNNIDLDRLATPSSSLSDIELEISELITGYRIKQGYSIKSYIGSAPTLLNASRATNFVYEVQNFSITDIPLVNNINTNSKIIDRLNKIATLNGNLVFKKVNNDVFSANLLMLDTGLEKMLAEILLYSYTANEKDCKAVINAIQSVNPFGFPSPNFYEYKFKQFLCAKALGLEPSKSWCGEDEANGGFIVAKDNGEVVAYHLYNRDQFKQYLFTNTFFERASTKKHDYGYLYEENGKVYIALNMQIRFKG